MSIQNDGSYDAAAGGHDACTDRRRNVIVSVCERFWLRWMRLCGLHRNVR